MRTKLRLMNVLVIFVMLLTTLSGPTANPVMAAPRSAGISLATPYSQNFDSLMGTPNTWADDTTIPGWYAVTEAKTISTYTVSTGSGNSGALYSFGSASASDRALGSICSGSFCDIVATPVVPGYAYFGVRMTNSLSSDLTLLDVTYTGEQWRVANTAPHKLVFEYQVGATDLKTGKWLPITELDFTSPTLLAAGATAAALDGNAAANRTTINHPFKVLIPAGADIMLRWSDLNDAGGDHALAIDDLMIGAYTEPPPSVLSTAPAKGDTGVARDANIDITFSEAVNFADANWYTLTCATSGAHDVVVSNSGSTFTLNPDVDFGYSELCTGTVLAAKVTDVDSSYHMLLDYSFSFTTVAPPDLTVLSTTPADGATGVLVTSPFAITFSESVNVGTDWYTFTCDGDPVASTASAAPAATITITPDANLPYHTACTVTVDPSKVSSVSSGGATLLTGANTWSFTTQWQPVNVTTTVPANGATNVPVDTTFEINFNQSVAVTGTWYNFTCNNTPVASSVLPAGPADTYIITPTANLSDVNMCTVSLVPANITGAASGVALTGTSSFSFSTPSPDGCPVPPVTHLLQPSIGSVQGTGLTAAKTGNLTLKGTLTNRSINGNGASPAQYGFYIQDAGDSEPLTSDGMFVYTTQGSTIPVGSAVMVTGAVSEYNKGTQITPVANGVVACGTASVIAPVTVNLPDDSDPVNLLERFENMLVHMPQEFTIDQNYFQGRYGQLTLSPGGRLYNPTNGNLPGTVPDQIAANNRRMIVLDDNNYVQNPTLVPYLGTDAYPYADIFHPTRAGDLILGGTAPEQGLTGILDQGATNSSAGTYSPWYRIQPTVWPVITRGANLRTAAPANPGGNVKVAGFNLLNYFTTLDKEPERSTPPYGGSNTPRGADSQIELERQRAKTVAAIIALGADVTGVIEVENNGAIAISDLVDYLNLATAPNTYDYVRDNIPLPPTSDFIKAAIIYKPMFVTPVGASVWSNADIFDRPPLAQTFKSNLSGEQFTVVVNHFKSKGCPKEGEPGYGVDPDLGQGCWNVKRTAQASALLDFINTTLVPVDPDVVAVGDYNAYGAEDPITTLTAPGALINELLRVPAADRYTYVFDGQAGYLDHALMTASLDSQVTGVSIWHLNADEASLIDYNTEFKPTDPYDGTVPNRASDHDPVLIGLNLNSAPQAANPIPNQTGAVWRAFQFIFAANTFSDANLANGDKLTYSADLESGAALPAWLQLNSATRTFSGTPTGPAVLRVRVTATDQSGASASTVFTLTVKAMFWMPVIGR